MYSACSGKTKKGTSCTRKLKEGEKVCWQHREKEDTAHIVSGNIALFDNLDGDLWEEEYSTIMNKKYAKGTRHYSTHVECNLYKGEGTPPLFIVPRVRGGPSYKTIPLEGVTPDEVYYALISKGFPMQDLSSFTIGPIVGEGLCLVNAAFSCCIGIMHIEGGGQLDLKRKNFWRRARNPERKIEILNDNSILVNGKKHSIIKWLSSHEDLWLEQWDLWRKHVAMASTGSFHWCENTLAYRHHDKYLDFVTWKRECYIQPSYKLLPKTDAYKFLRKVWHGGKALGLVHPKGISEHPEQRITKEFITELYNSPTEMCCQPFVIAGLLLGAQ